MHQKTFLLIAIKRILRYNIQINARKGSPMRIFNQYTFTVGNTEFAGIFPLVEHFLEQQGLHYEKLCCELRDGCQDQTLRTSIAKDKRIIPNRKSAVVFGLEDLLRNHSHFFTCGSLTRMEIPARNSDELVDRKSTRLNSSHAT